MSCAILQIARRRSPEASHRSAAAMSALPALWAAPSEGAHPDRAASRCCTSVYARLVQVPTSSSPWVAQAPSAAGEVISPLEKKKRMAQASLSCPPGEEKGRPSVIQCSQANSSHSCNSSDGSPVPLSPASSRSPSPYSVSSEDGAAAESGARAARGPASADTSAGPGERKSACGEDSKPSGCAESFTEGKDNSQFAALVKASAWRATQAANDKSFPHTLRPHPASALKSGWAPASTSSFTKVTPRAVRPLRPAPVRPAYKSHQGRSVQPDDCLACAAKLMAPWYSQVERRDKSRPPLPKAPPASHGLGLPQPPAGRPSSRVASSYDKSGRGSQQQSILVCPSILPNRLRPASALPLAYLPQPAVFSSSLYSHPYTIPPLIPQTGFISPGLTSVYHHTL